MKNRLYNIKNCKILSRMRFEPMPFRPVPEAGALDQLDHLNFVVTMHN